MLDAPRPLAVARLGLLTLLFAAVACSEAPPTSLSPDATPTVADTGPFANTNGQASNAPGAADPIRFSNTFEDRDPCTGAVHTITIAGIIWVYQLPNGNQVVRWDRTITTDTGYEGRGARTEVHNGNVFKLTNTDIVSHPDGRKFLAQGRVVLDLRTEPPTVRSQTGGFTCIRS